MLKHSGAMVAKRTVGLGIDKAYSDLKSTLLKSGCKIISEEPPKQILFKQGSLWGVSPKTAKKTVSVNFASVDSGTQITCSSRLSSDWKNLTVAGCALAAVMVGLCLWIMLDLQGFMATQKSNFWSWLATVNGGVDSAIGQTLVNLTKGLAIFLSVVIVLEIVIVVYAQVRIDKFAEASLPTVETENICKR